MDLYLTPAEVADRVFHEPTKSKASTIARQCRDGVFEHAERVGCRWLINATKQWPNLNLRADPQDAAVAADVEPARDDSPLASVTTEELVGELFARIGFVPGAQTAGR